MHFRRGLLAALVVAAFGVILVTFAVVGSGRGGPGCEPTIPPVDPQATTAARCVAAALDAWKAESLMGVGQQLDVQEAGRMHQPLDALGPLHPAVLGFDFDELLNAQEFFDNDPVPFLADQAAQGRVLTATWHVHNPVTGGSFDDRSWTRIVELLDPSSDASATFWPEYDQVLAQARRFQELDVAIIFKPLHEASGSYFWWAAPDPATYRRLYAELQQRAFDSGTHNLLWAYAAHPRLYETDADPVTLLPDAVDLVGIDVYDEPGVPQLTTVSFRELDAASPRMALTEVGPRNSRDGDWDPAIIVDTLRAEGLYASYAMLWRDEPQPGNVYQLSSVTGGLAWLASCPDGLCRL